MKILTIAAVILLSLMASFVQLQAQDKFYLNSDKTVKWLIKADLDLKGNKVKPYQPELNTENWVQGIVPGTVFSTYVAAGLEKDPNYADNIYQVDKKKYDRGFWYRTQFNLPKNHQSEKIWLNFEGINRKGDIYFNNQFIGRLDGFMQRGKFDITELIEKDKPNTLAVLVYCPQTPVTNYASPTYTSSSSWDWMPYVPGLNSGITDDVYITSSGMVTLNDPWIRTDKLADGEAELSLSVLLKNHSDEKKEGLLSGIMQPGNISFSKKVNIGAHQQQILKLDSRSTKALSIKNPKLWWPNGYGTPNLYVADLKFTVNDQLSDETKITFGIRKYTYDTLDNVLHIAINGKRIFVKGGNWGMSEYMLRCRGEEYDLKVKLHKEMNFNMIRNWIGSVTDEEFYAACDKYGMMVWDDFWLNSHPNLPTDVLAFNANAVEKIKRLRNHASIAVWCGDNEGYPLPPLNNWLKEDVAVFDAADRLYQANSHADALTGSGPWTNSQPSWYFTKYPNGFGGDKGWGFRTEIGTAVFTTFDSFKKFMPENTWWPRNEMWDKHFFGPSAANAGPDHYEKTISQSYGRSTGIEDFCRKAQLVNIETNKALYEGWQHNMWNDASGVMTWMSQSAYPSLVWQTYDYYYDLNGAYWGVKKACEPVHIQWNSADNTVKVVNTSGGDLADLKASAMIYDINGNEIKNLSKMTVVNSKTNSLSDCFTLAFEADKSNLAYLKPVYSSSTEKGSAANIAVTDGNGYTRWSSKNADGEWIYVDLGTVKTIGAIALNWEAAYAKKYQLELSNDAAHWQTVYEASDSKGGYEFLKIDQVKARYVRILGIKRAIEYGYSLWDFEVYENQNPVAPKLNFIKLQLKNKNGRLLSDNFYWRSDKNSDYTALNSLPEPKLKTLSKAVKKDGRYLINVKVSNSSATPAFAIRVKAVNAKNGEQILPAIMTDDYFTLMKGETKDLQIDFDENLLQDGKYKILVEAYNNK